MSGGNDFGFIIFAERADREIPGFIKNPTFRILIQGTTKRRRSRSWGRATVRGMRSKKEFEE